MIMKNTVYFFLAFLFITNGLLAQDKPTYWDNIKERESTLGISEGFSEFKTREFTLKLVNASQTVAGLYPNSNPDFDFTPGERIDIRDKDSIYYLGDLNFRIKTEQGDWQSFSTATERKQVEKLSVSGNQLAAADLTNTLPDSNPLKIKRFYEEKDGDLVLRFQITNPTQNSVEIGALGAPMAFNNILEGKTLDQTHADNVFLILI